ncbi:hypothetical protein [Pontibacter ruber]|uniref:Uncharacterized protein n=1 Tax=Pontibacter ruber TaxID=1343895 RepID=A0ABW5D338_9BACT|nr:hypothetical protein [Pontibacter ruber]
MEPMYIYTSARQVKQWYGLQEEASSAKTEVQQETGSDCASCCRKEQQQQVE